MKIAVIGTGAIGSVIGGLLSKAGEDVTLIGRKEHVETIKEKGLIIDGALGRMLVRVKAQEYLDFMPDLALLAIKTQDVEIAVREIEPYVSGIPIVTMQNGVQSDRLVASVLGKGNVISCVVLFGGTFLEPGRAIYSPKGVLAIGEPFRSNGKRVNDIAAVLDKAMPTHISGNIHGAHWTKLIMNLNNAIPAITGLSIQETSDQPELRKLSVMLMREGLNTTRAVDIELSSLPNLPISVIKTMLKMPVPAVSLLLKLMSKSMGNVPVFGSTLQSIKRSKTTEIDYLNGEIVGLGKKSGIPTPYNTVVVDMVHQVEATGKFLTTDEVMAAVENGMRK